MTHRISTIDTRHKTISHPYIQKGITFKKVLCQYTIFEQVVCYVECVFEGDVFFGDEKIDKAYSVVNSDLIFENCIFKKKVKLDGLQCAGHVVFKKCRFLYGDEESHYDEVLSMSNAKVGIGIIISNSDFRAGINFSAIHVNQVGCQFSNVRLNNPLSSILFTSSYMGRELSINYSNIVCKDIDFERTAVDPIHGSIQMKGFYYDQKEIINILAEFFHVTIFPESWRWIASFYKAKDLSKSPIIAHHAEDVDMQWIKYCLNHMDETLLTNGVKDAEEVQLFDSERYAINGDLLFLENVDRSNYYVLSLNGRIYILERKDNNLTSAILQLNDFAPLLFSKIVLEKDVNWVDYKLSSHLGVPMIYATASNNDKYIAIYDECIGFKIYKWNYIECAAVSNMFRSNVGTGLYILQSEFFVAKFDIHGLSASSDIKFEDVVLKTKLLNTSEIQTSNFVINNVEFVCNDEKKGIWLYPEDEDYFGINIDLATISNKSRISSFLILNEKECDIKISATYLSSKILELIDILAISSKDHILTIDLQKAKLIQWIIGRTNKIPYKMETENILFDDFKINGGFQYKLIKEMQSIGAVIGSVEEEKERKTSPPIHFLKQLDIICEKRDSYDEHCKLWKLRNRRRIRRDHKRTSWLRIIVNELLLNYGWSPWRIIFWLIVSIFVFDITTCSFFGMDPLTSIVNGFVEFVPVSFNEPIVEQLHGVNPKDPKYGPPLLSLGYSALVTGYRLLSYTLLSVLIAAWAGYFRKKNQ